MSYLNKLRNLFNMTKIDEFGKCNFKEISWTQNTVFDGLPYTKIKNATPIKISINKQSLMIDS